MMMPTRLSATRSAPSSKALPRSQSHPMANGLRHEGMARHRQTTRQRGHLCHLTQLISHRRRRQHLVSEPGELPQHPASVGVTLWQPADHPTSKSHHPQHQDGHAPHNLRRDDRILACAYITGRFPDLNAVPVLPPWTTQSFLPGPRMNGWDPPAPSSPSCYSPKPDTTSALSETVWRLGAAQGPSMMPLPASGDTKESVPFR